MRQAQAATLAMVGSPATTTLARHLFKFASPHLGARARLRWLVSPLERALRYADWLAPPHALPRSQPVRRMDCCFAPAGQST